MGVGGCLRGPGSPAPGPCSSPVWGRAAWLRVSPRRERGPPRPILALSSRHTGGHRSPQSVRKTGIRPQLIQTAHCTLSTVWSGHVTWRTGLRGGGTADRGQRASRAPCGWGSAVFLQRHMLAGSGTGPPRQRAMSPLKTGPQTPPRVQGGAHGLPGRAEPLAAPQSTQLQGQLSPLHSGGRGRQAAGS